MFPKLIAVDVAVVGTLICILGENGADTKLILTITTMRRGENVALKPVALSVTVAEIDALAGSAQKRSNDAATKKYNAMNWVRIYIFF